MTNLNGRHVHVSEMPPDLLHMRERWRHFWSWFPIIGSLYKRRFNKKYNKWLDDNNLDGVYGSM